MANGEKYAGFTKDATAEQVAALFEARRGYRPLEVLDGKAIWLVGPLNGKKPSLLRRIAREPRMTPEQARQLVMSLEVESERTTD